MGFLRRLRWTFIIACAFLALLVAASVLVTQTGMTINLDGLRDKIEAAATEALGREVQVTGTLAIIPTLRPTLTVQDVHITNPPRWRGSDLMRLNSARIQIDILSLLRGRLEIQELAAQGVDVALESTATGENNWQLNRWRLDTKTDTAPGLQFAGLERLVLQDVAVTYLAGKSQSVYALRFEGITGAIPSDGPLDLAIQGAFQEQPYTIQLAGGPIGDLMIHRKPWEMDLAMTAKGAHLRVSGIVAEPTAATSTDLRLEVAGDRIGDLSPWLGVSPAVDAPYSVTGQLALLATEHRLSVEHAQLGQTRFSGDLGLRDILTRPVFYANLSFSLLDPKGFEGLFAPESKAEEKTDRGSTPILDWRLLILPKRVKFEDADVDLRAERVLLEPTDLTRVFLKGRFRNGRMEKSDFQVRIGDTSLKGDLALDLRDGTPAAALNLHSENVNVGELLGALAITNAVDASAGRLQMTLSGHGKTVGGFLEQADFSANLENGQWLLDDPHLPGQTRIRVDKGILTASADRPIALSLDGAIDRTPVKIELQGASMAALINPPERVKLRLSAEAAGNRLELNGGVALPIEQTKLSLELSLRGKRLDRLEPVLGVQLPPLGAYAAKATLNTVKDGYYLSNLDLFVGQSHLYGGAALQITNQRPHVQIGLSASTLQLNDFFGPELAVGSLLGDAKQIASPAPDTAAKTATAWEELLDPEFLQSFDGGVEIKTIRVLSGKDPLGSGHVVATLVDGHLSISPMRLQLPSGSVAGRFALAPLQTGLAAELSLKADRFDYGITARRIDPETEMGGLITLDVNLTSRGPNLAGLFTKASGHAHFAIWPARFEAGVMDIWAMNVFTAAMPKVEGPGSSRINCIVGRLNSHEGIMSPELFVIDTTKVRAAGSGRIDMTQDSLDLVLVPRVKKAKLFSLDTPVLIQGTFSDFEVTVTSADLLRTTARLAFEVYYLPLALLLKTGVGVIPDDGHDLCDQPMAWSGDPLR
jgi:hypothetical protein